MVRESTNGPGDWSSIPGRIIPKNQMVLDNSFLNAQQDRLWIKGKWSNTRKGMVTSHTPWCSSY